MQSVLVKLLLRLVDTNPSDPKLMVKGKIQADEVDLDPTTLFNDCELSLLIQEALSNVNQNSK